MFTLVNLTLKLCSIEPNLILDVYGCVDNLNGINMVVFTTELNKNSQNCTLIGRFWFERNIILSIIFIPCSVPICVVAMNKFFQLYFFNSRSGWFLDWSMMVMDVMNQKRNVNDMFLTVDKIVLINKYKKQFTEIK